MYWTSAARRSAITEASLVRIALVTQGFQTGGGVSTITRWLRQGLARAGHEVHVHDLAASSRDGLSRRTLSPRSWLPGPAWRPSETDPGVCFWGANWVEFEGQRYQPRAALTAVLDTYSIVQVVAGAPALALAVSKSTTPKALQVATTVLLETPTQLPKMHPLKRTAKALGLRTMHRREMQALQAMDHVLVENRFMEQWVLKSGQKNVTFAPPGIDTVKFKPAGAWNGARPVIAFGRLGDSRKDWPTAIKAYELFAERSALDNRLVLAGKGPLSADLLRALAASPARRSIDIRENVPQSQLPELLQTASVFLQSSLEEGLGLAGLEAMACGLPVVATRTVGSEEYVRSGENGYLVDLGPNAAEGLAEALWQTLSGGSGSSLSAEALRTCTSTYASDIALERFLRIYETLISA